MANDDEAKNKERVDDADSNKKKRGKYGNAARRREAGATSETIRE